MTVAPLRLGGNGYFYISREDPYSFYMNGLQDSFTRLTHVLAHIFGGTHLDARGTSRRESGPLACREHRPCLPRWCASGRGRAERYVIPREPLRGFA